VTQEREITSPNLFAPGNANSNLCEGRPVSAYAGTVFQAEYGNTFKLGSKRRFFGRIVDLQPHLVEGKVQGVTILYKKGRFEDNAWSEDNALEEHTFGPFDSLSSSTVQVNIPTQKEEGEEAPPERKAKSSMWALNQQQRPDQEVNHQLTLKLMPGV
jgi:hypothetical protein